MNRNVVYNKRTRMMSLRQRLMIATNVPNVKFLFWWSTDGATKPIATNA